MSPSLPIFWLVAELLVAPAAMGGSAETCQVNCAKLTKEFEKACKKSGGGKCAGQAKALGNDLDKKCAEDCAKRRSK